MVTCERAQAAQLPSGIQIGHMSNSEATTGCTAILCAEGAVGSVAVRGGAPASRETDLLAPHNMVQTVHAVVLSGGSAFGLDAASGVMRYLSEQGIGLPFNDAVVPIVAGLSLFDLDFATNAQGDRPDADMGYAAAEQIGSEVGKTGNVGAGTGACVGRFLGAGNAMKGGLGVASVLSGDLLVTAVIAVNSLGNVYDRKTNQYLAGALIEQDGRVAIAEPLDYLAQILGESVPERAHTSIGAVLTNATLDKSHAYRVASMAHDGLARSIYPAHTSFDGDGLFTLATGKVVAHPDLIGSLAALVVEEAVHDAVLSASEAHEHPAVASLGKRQS